MIAGIEAMAVQCGSTLAHKLTNQKKVKVPMMIPISERSKAVGDLNLRRAGINNIKMNRLNDKN